MHIKCGVFIETDSWEAIPDKYILTPNLGSPACCVKHGLVYDLTTTTVIRLNSFVK